MGVITEELLMDKNGIIQYVREGYEEGALNKVAQKIKNYLLNSAAF